MVSTDIKCLNVVVIYVIIVWMSCYAKFSTKLLSGEGSRTCHIILTWCICALQMVSWGIYELPETCDPISLIVRIYWLA